MQARHEQDGDKADLSKTIIIFVLGGPGMLPLQLI